MNANIKTLPGKLDDRERLDFKLAQGKIFGYENCKKYFEELFPDYRFSTEALKNRFFEELKEFEEKRAVEEMRELIGKSEGL